MTFANPLFLWGGFAAFIPVIIHLWGRRRPRRVPFPSLMLLQASHQQQSTFRRLRDLILLALRVLLILMVALALAGPSTTSAWLRPIAGGITMVLLDSSYSMAYRDGDLTNFDKAKQVAARLVEGGRDKIWLAMAGEDVQPLSPTPLTDQETLEGLLPQANVTHQHGDIAASLLSACELLQSRNLPGAVVLITDMQEASVSPLDASGRDLLRKTSVQLVDVSVPSAANVCLESLRPVDGVAVTGRPCRLRAKVRAYGGAAEQKLQVNLIAGKWHSPVRSLAVGPNESAEIDITVPAHPPGELLCRAQIAGDLLEADNTRWVVVPVRERISVAVVGVSRRTRFIRLALEPAPGGPVQVRDLTADEVSIAALEGCDTMVLGDIPRLSEEATEALLTHHRDGTGLIIFIGPQTDSEWYNDILLPRLVGLDQPVVHSRASGAGGDLLAAAFWGYWQLVESPEALQVLARLIDGTPWLLHVPTCSCSTPHRIPNGPTCRATPHGWR